MALSTRPSHPEEGRTEPGTADTRARQPRRTPSRNRERHQQRITAAKKPTTSQGMGFCVVSMTTRAPTYMA